MKRSLKQGPGGWGWRGGLWPAETNTPQTDRRGQGRPACLKLKKHFDDGDLPAKSPAAGNLNLSILSPPSEVVVHSRRLPVVPVGGFVQREKLCSLARYRSASVVPAFCSVPSWHDERNRQAGRSRCGVCEIVATKTYVDVCVWQQNYGTEIPNRI